MDFFQQQDIARRNARLLVLLFIFAVFLLIVLANALVAAFLFFSQDYSIYSGSREGMEGFGSYFSWERFGFIGLTVTATVALVVLVKWIQLSTGGKAVAESMGGIRILPQTDDPAERRCLNVIEEMALAANMPVPSVYVMNNERGINAFAAGIVPADAIVAVTRGTIEHLKRHELQGVIGHEFSHILNGDMRLSIRLAAMLKGITFIGDVGHILLRSSSRVRTSANARNNSGAALPLLGLALWILGWLGGLAAGFIKAAISRQKEYLADASAVQFTRDNQAIGDALKVIGGYIPGTLVHAARANEMSHIFFGQVEHHLWQLFATHPPLEKRILRVEPGWDGIFIKRKPQHYKDRPTNRQTSEAGVGRAAIVAAAIAAQTMEGQKTLEDADFADISTDLSTETAREQHIPHTFIQHSREPLGAQAILCSLLMSDVEEARSRQLELLSASGVTGLADLTFTLAPGIAELGAPRRLPLIELCLPALKSMSLRQYRTLKTSLVKLIRADARTELYEWCLYQLVRHYLDPEYIQVRPSRPRYRRLDKVSEQIHITLSVLAHEGSGQAESVFALGSQELGFDSMALLPREKCSVALFSQAVHELADCYPLLKPRLLKAMALAAGSDGQLSPVEREIIASMAAVMDSPVPGALDC